MEMLHVKYNFLLFKLALFSGSSDTTSGWTEMNCIAISLRTQTFLACVHVQRVCVYFVCIFQTVSHRLLTNWKCTTPVFIVPLRAHMHCLAYGTRAAWQQFPPMIRLLPKCHSSSNVLHLRVYLSLVLISSSRVDSRDWIYWKLL